MKVQPKTTLNPLEAVLLRLVGLTYEVQQNQRSKPDIAVGKIVM